MCLRKWLRMVERRAFARSDLEILSGMDKMFVMADVLLAEVQTSEATVRSERLETLRASSSRITLSFSGL